MGGRDDHHEPFLLQDVPAVRPLRRGRGDRQVDRSQPEVPGDLVPGLLPELDAYGGCAGVEGPEQRGNERGRHRVEEGEADQAGVDVEDPGERRHELAVARGQVPGGVDHEDAGRCGADPVGHPVEEPRAQLDLAAGERPGERRLRGAELFRGGGHVLVVGDGDEPLEVTELHAGILDPRHALGV